MMQQGFNAFLRFTVHILLYSAVWLPHVQLYGAIQAEALLQRAQDANILSDSARQYLSDLLLYATDHRLPEYSAQAHYLLGRHHALLSDQYEARHHYHRAAEIYEELGMFEQQGLALERLGVAYQYAGLLDSSILCYQRIAGLYQTHNLYGRLWNPFIGISNIHSKMGNAQQAFQYGEMALDIATRGEDRATLVIVLRHLISHAQSFDSLHLFIRYADQMIRLFTPLEIDDRMLQHIAYQPPGTAPDECIRMIREHITQLSALPSTLELIHAWYQLGECHAESGDLSSAINAWQTAFAIEKDLGHAHYRLLLLRALSSACARGGDFENAFMYQQAYATLKDSLRQQYYHAKTEELHVRYETQLKDHELARQAQTISRRTQQRNLTLIAVFLILIAGGYVFYSQRRSLRDQTTIAEQQQLLHEKQVQQINKTHELEMLQALITAQEDERNRIAQDLHDGLGGLLATLRQRASGTLHLDASENGKTGEFLSILDDAGSEVRRIAHNMMPRALIRMGLVAALEDLAVHLQSSGKLHVHFHCLNYDIDMGKEQEIALYRIAQELCTNVIKHSGASEVIIQLSHDDGIAVLTIEDNGNGFDPAFHDHGGTGLGNVRSRVAFLDGELELDSTPDTGTSVTIQIPIV